MLHTIWLSRSNCKFCHDQVRNNSWHKRNEIDILHKKNLSLNNKIPWSKQSITAMLPIKKCIWHTVETFILRKFRNFPWTYGKFTFQCFINHGKWRKKILNYAGMAYLWVNEKYQSGAFALIRFNATSGSPRRPVNMF